MTAWLRHVCTCDIEAALKLRAVLQVNPRRLRPTLSKKAKAKAVKQEQSQVVKKEKKEQLRVLFSTEVWEIESDSDSDIELVAVAMAAPSASPSPKARGSLSSCIHGSAVHSMLYAWKKCLQAPPYDYSQQWWSIFHAAWAAPARLAACVLGFASI